MQPTSMVSRAPQRLDAWWVQPVVTVAVLGAFVLYATWAGLQNANYYADPYLSPFYSPCLSANCAHVSVPLLGSWWRWSVTDNAIIPLKERVADEFYDPLQWAWRKVTGRGSAAK